MAKKEKGLTYVGQTVSQIDEDHKQINDMIAKLKGDRRKKLQRTTTLEKIS